MKDSFWQRLFRGVRRVRQRNGWEEFAGPGWVDRVMGLDLRDRLHVKQGRSIVRWTLHADGRSLVVFLKRHYRLPWRDGLLALAWPRRPWSPALQEWEHLEWARAEGLPVPRAAAAGEFVGPRGRLQSFIAVEELTDMLPLHEAVPLARERLGPRAFVRWKRGLAAEMTAITLALHRRNHFHRDLYLCHFYVADADTARVPDDWRGRVRIIDFHRLARRPLTWFWWQAKDLAQLLYSSDVPGVTVRDRVYFWRAYTAGGRPGFASVLLRAIVRFKAWNNHRRHLRKRRRLPPPRSGAA